RDLAGRQGDESDAQIRIARIDARYVRERGTRTEHGDSDWITWEIQIPKPKSQIPIRVRGHFSVPSSFVRRISLGFGIWDLGFGIYPRKNRYAGLSDSIVYS